MHSLRAHHLDGSPTAQLRRVSDWLAFECSSEQPPYFVLGAGVGPALFYFPRNEGQHKAGWHVLKGARLPRGTLLVAEIVKERLGAGGELDAVHAFDAACINGDDVRRLPYAKRRERLEYLVHALEKDPEAGHTQVPLRLKRAYRPADLASAMSAEERQFAQPFYGMLLAPMRGSTIPPLPGNPADWVPAKSKSQGGRAYLFNKSNGKAESGMTVWSDERERERRPLSFRSCAEAILKWDFMTAEAGAGRDELLAWGGAAGAP